ncbi:hypothetical protein Moror_8839 [Moniliophthora roreri MCA 2997]|uniref:F-box domain-containing protein n=2 Tax=Moniliophthora roreri TaxID=221103 RepID=V2XJX2_MONRO|nr:hypothetical protein Moror_8839 [Moniliophthora roreri MCA 2997]KAI3604840.1 hypothetical protein WG66_008562 [Moniliophthora roreri]
MNGRAGRRNGLEDTPSSRLQQWIAVTHVCRDWRTKALEYPLLWSSPDFSLPLLAQEMISRAASVPLHIHVNLDNLGTTFASSVFLTALNHPAGIAALHIRTKYSCREMTSVFSLLAKPAPLLYSLGIHMDFPFSLPQPLLGGSAPRLRKMSLSCCQGSWNFSFLRTLTTLEIAGIDGIPRFATITELLEILRGMQRLEQLALQDCLPFEPEASNVTIRLPRLRLVRVSSTILACVGLLGHLSFPDSTEISVGCYYTDRDQAQGIAVLISWVKSLFQGSFGRKRIKYLVVGDESPNAVLEAGFETDEDATHGILPTFGTCSPYKPQLPFLRINVCWSSRVTPTSQIGSALSNIIQTLPLQELETLRVQRHWCDILTPSAFTDCFSKCPRLRNILIQGNVVDEFTKPLRATVKASGFPSLQNLYLSLVLRYDSHRLLKCLKLRSKGDMKLKQIVFKDCGMRDLGYYVDQIRPFVQDVQVI